MRRPSGVCGRTCCCRPAGSRAPAQANFHARSLCVRNFQFFSSKLPPTIPSGRFSSITCCQCSRFELSMLFGLELARCGNGGSWIAWHRVGGDCALPSIQFNSIRFNSARISISKLAEANREHRLRAAQAAGRASGVGGATQAEAPARLSLDWLENLTAGAQQSAGLSCRAQCVNIGG